jgi:hypothetical protein
LKGIFRRPSPPSNLLYKRILDSVLSNSRLQVASSSYVERIELGTRSIKRLKKYFDGPASSGSGRG